MWSLVKRARSSRCSGLVTLLAESMFISTCHRLTTEILCKKVVYEVKTNPRRADSSLLIQKVRFVFPQHAGSEQDQPGAVVCADSRVELQDRDVVALAHEFTQYLSNRISVLQAPVPKRDLSFLCHAFQNRKWRCFRVASNKQPVKVAVALVPGNMKHEI